MDQYYSVLEITTARSDLGNLGFERAEPGQLSSPWRVGAAADFNELCRAFHLIYRCYLERGDISAHPSGIHFSAYQLLPATRTLVAVSSSGVSGTLSIVNDSPAGLPAEGLFPREVEKMRSAGRTLAQSCMLAWNPATDAALGRANIRLMRAVFWWCADSAVDDLCAVIPLSYAKTFERVLGLEQISNAKRSPQLRDTRVILAHLDLWKVFHEGRKASPLIERFLREPVGTTQPESDYVLSKAEAALLLNERPDIFEQTAC